MGLFSATMPNDFFELTERYKIDPKRSGEATHAHFGTIRYLSEPSDVPYSPKQFLGWDFCCCFLQQTGSNTTNFLVDAVTKNGEEEECGIN